MDDTINPKKNCWESNKIVEIDTNSYELDSNILREFDNPMNLSDIDSEITNFNQPNELNENCSRVLNKDFKFTYSNNKSIKSFDKKLTSVETLFGRNHFDVDIDLESIGSKENEINPEFINNASLEYPIIKHETILTSDISINKTGQSLNTINEKNLSVISTPVDKSKTNSIKENIPKVDFGVQSENIIFGGFKTATGRIIPKSEIGEMKAKQIFANIDENLQAELNISIGNQIMLPESSEKKTIEQEDNGNNSLRKPVGVFSKQTDKFKPILLRENIPINCKSTVCEGFKTAAGHSIPKSESAERKARQIFASIEEENIRDRIIIGEEDPVKISLDNKYKNSNDFNSIPMKNQEIQLQKLEKFTKREIENRQQITFESIEKENIDKNFPNNPNQNLIRSESELIIENTFQKEVFFTEPINKSAENSHGFCYGFKTGTGRVIPLSESSEIKARKLFDSIEKDIIENISGLVHCSLNSDTTNENLCSLEENPINPKEIVVRLEDEKAGNTFENINPEQYNDENNEKTIIEEKNSVKASVNYQTNPVQYENSSILIKQHLNKSIKEVENMDFSWDYFDFTESQETKTNINPSPIVDKSHKTLSSEEFHRLSSTPIKKIRNRAVTDITNSLNDSLSGRTGASMILQENIASKNVTIISAKPGRFSEFRLDKCNLFSLRKLCKLPSKQNATVPTDSNYYRNIDFNTCVDMKFCCDKSVVSLIVGDNGIIVPDNDGFIGLPQFIDSFMGLPNVDPKLISNDWITNHYRMILWKLLALDNRYREYLADDWLSPHHIMLQLKYRYDKEIDHAKRPALRKICELDDSASKRLVLIVVSIDKIENESFKVLVSDGWYFVPAIFDKVLKDQIINKKIKVGTKLITCNAVWIGLDGPITLPTSSFPLNCGLKMHGNSTRRARAFSKLGYQLDMTPFPLTLGSLNPNGGTVSMINVIINRVYPIQYMETIYHPNQENPQRIFRTERAEEFARKQFDQSKEKIVNSTLEKMLTPISTSSKRQKMDKVANLNNGEEILNWLNNSIDQDSAQIELSFDQQNILRAYKENLVTEALQTKCPNRNVVTLLRILVSGCFAADVDSKQVALLTLWKPGDELMALLVEGTPVKIYSVAVTHAKLDISFSVACSSVALNSTSGTRFERNSDIHENLVAKLYQCRQSFSIVNACQFLSNATSSYEIDCIGIVIALSKVTTTSNDFWQHVVLSDPNNMNDGIILLKLWGGLQGNFLTNVIEMGNSVKFINLQYRKSLYSRFAPHSQTLIFECHYGTHSNAVYVSRKWNFFTIKQSLHDQLNKFLPSFEILTQDKNISKLFYSKISSPLISKENMIKSSPIDKSLLQLNDSPKIITSTPKRLGLSGKRVMRTSVTELSSKSIEVLNTARIEETVEDSIPVDSISYADDGFDMNCTIAEFVKTRRRTFTSNTRYNSNKKNK